MDDAAFMILEGEVGGDEGNWLLGNVIQGRGRELHGLAILAPFTLASACDSAEDDPVKDGRVEGIGVM